MWRYEKRLQYPVNIKTPEIRRIAQYIMSQYGGPDGEIGASMRYLSQRYTMPYKMQKGLLTDIGTEELAHMEMIAAIVPPHAQPYSGTIQSSGFGPYYLSTTPRQSAAAAGESRSMRASSSRRAMRSRIYMRIWQQSRKPAQPTTIFSAWSKIRKYANPIRFLREREIVHFRAVW